MNNILVIAAHPDDEIIGCGGTIAKHIENGDNVFVCIVCEGSSGRFEDKYYITPEERAQIITNEIKKRESAAINAAKFLGVKDIYLMNLPNLELNNIPQLKVNKLMEDYIEKIKPDIVYTHSKCDINIDHIATHNSTMIATRNIKDIITYEIIGSTTNDFIPNLFIDIEDTYEKKKKALEFYIDEMKEYPHPRSIDGIEILAKYRGINSSMKMSEAFKIIRNIK